MKKIVIISFITLLLISLIAPKFVGSQLNSSLNNILVTVNEMPGYSMHIKEIESHWFSTNAILIFEIKTAELTQSKNDSLEDFLIEVNYNASHGPLRFGDNSGIGWLGWTAKVEGKMLREFMTWPLEQAFYQAQGDMNLFANHTYKDVISKFTASIPEVHFTADFSGYHGEGFYNGETLDYTSKIEGFNVTSEEVDIAGNNISIDMLLESSIEQLLKNGLYDSSSKVNFANVNFINKESATEVDFTNLYMTAVTQLNKEQQLMDMNISYGVNNVKVDDFSADDIAMDFEVKNLSGKFLKAFQKHNADIANAGGVIAPEQVKDFFTNNLLLLVSKNPEINITSLRATLPQGKFTSYLHTSLVNINALPAQLEDPSFWLTHTLIDANINGDKAAIEWLGVNIIKLQLAQDPRADDMSDEQITEVAKQQVPPMLAMFTEQGFITATDEHYDATLTLKDKVLTLSGKVIPLPF